jgi:hypothetical protein
MEVHVASVCFKCFRYFRGMLQLFHMDVAKTDQGCCTYCKCFRSMLQLFHMDIAKIDQGYCTYCKCFRGVQNVLFLPNVCCKRFNLDVAHVSHICCKICLKCFNCFSLLLQCMFTWWQVASVLSDVAYVSHICYKYMF